MDTYETIKEKIVNFPAAVELFNAIEENVKNGIAGVDGPFMFKITRELTDEERKEVIALSFLGKFDKLIEKDFIESDKKVDGEPLDA